MPNQLLPEMKSPATACDVLHELAQEVILKNARWSLKHSAYPQLWKITCDFYEGVLTLNGVVGSYFLKQLAHSTVVNVVGINKVINQLCVQYPDPENKEKI